MATPEQNKTDPYTANPNQHVYDAPHQKDFVTEVLKIYFAEQVPKFKWEPKEEVYTAKGGEKITAVKKKHEKKGRKNIQADPDHNKPLKKDDQVKITWDEEVEDGFVYKEIKKTVVNKKVFVVAQCTGERGKLTIEIHENKQQEAELVYDNPVKFLDGQAEQTKVDFTLSGAGEYAKEIRLRPKADADLKKLVEKFLKRKDKNAFLYFKASVSDAEGEVKYPDETHEFLNKDGEREEISGTPCYCNRDFTEKEVKDLIVAMRKVEKITSEALFNQENCPIDAADKTYARLTTELNLAMNKYNINTCIRKIHFLAQSYHESSRYGTTLEFASGTKYNPDNHDDAKKMENTVDGDGPRYKGRGILQITWRKSQKAYMTYALSKEPELFGGKTIDQLFDRTAQYKEKYIYFQDKKDDKGNVVTGKNGKPVKEKIVEEVDVDAASLIARNLHLAFDSSGWYWENLGNVTATNENINDVADKDDVLKVSQCINGKVAHPYGLQERKDFTKKLKELLDYDQACINKKK